MKYIISSIILLFLFGCNNKCKIKDNNFRPHKVRHVNKSKIYWYYHNTPCDCISISDDLYAPYQHTYKNYVEFYDNKQQIWEK